MLLKLGHSKSTRGQDLAAQLIEALLPDDKGFIISTPVDKVVTSATPNMIFSVIYCLDLHGAMSFYD